ncbi:MAG: FAD-dependent monooxygenase [Gallionella sp.]|nr:FAD-dependent monooxygenase [Gallionella sp.]MDD4945271.1 FAD-dependent monooxygenase [Gallionella sp.]MDD5613195.1 FAD-dependent monooxygenase [Gallionella sp.]
MNETNYDIAIIGGGPVGSALALALKDSPLKICVLEARPADTPSTDARALALSYGSRLLLDRLGVWHAIREVSPIRTIHISQKQSFGRALLRAKEMKVPELGYVLPYPALQDALTDALRGEAIETLYSASVTALESSDDQAVIRYRQGDAEYALRARLAVVADGGRLLAEKHPPAFRDYGQSAVIAHVTCTAPRADTAFERFTAQGPVALLPYMDGYEIVWTAPHDRAQEMLEWDDATFLTELHAHFGDRVGDFVSASKRSCFPLGLKKAPQQTPLPHVVLLGNAAQTMHPVAGQGFNLGLRDAWDLAQVILDATPATLGSDDMLAAYRADRRLDREAGIRFTDSLVRLFSNDLPLLGTTRAAALSALDCLPLAKKFVAKRMMFGANG